MKIKVPVTRSLIGKIDGANVSDVVSVEVYGNVNPGAIVKQYPGFSCIQQKKAHISFEVPDSEFLDFIKEKGKKVEKED